MHFLGRREICFWDWIGGALLSAVQPLDCWDGGGNVDAVHSLGHAEHLLCARLRFSAGGTVSTKQPGLRSPVRTFSEIIG